MVKNKEPDWSENNIKEVAIPAAIIVKDKILSARDDVIMTQEKVNYRRRRNMPIYNQMNDYQIAVERLYSYLREKFDEKEKIRKDLDRSIETGKQLSFKTLYKYACELKDKIEELKITKIERPEVDKDSVLG